MSCRIIAHRGASGTRPEHTESAYRRAFAQGADAVEPDLVLSRDGVVVIRHEHDLSRSTDVADRPEFADRQREGWSESGPVLGWFTEDFDWAELATLRAREPRPDWRPANAAHDDTEGILRFADLLAMLDEPAARTRSGELTMLVAELKDANAFARLGHDLPAAVLADLRSAGWQPNDPRLVFESFEPEPLRALAGWGTRVLLVEDAQWPSGGIAAADEFDGLSFETERLLREPDLPDRLHERGKLAYAYTLRAENGWLPEHYRIGSDPAAYGSWLPWFERVLASGLDAVFTDQADLAIEVRDALEAERVRGDA